MNTMNYWEDGQIFPYVAGSNSNWGSMTYWDNGIVAVYTVATTTTQFTPIIMWFF